MSKSSYYCPKVGANVRNPELLHSCHKVIYKILSPNPGTWGKILIMPMLLMVLMLMASGTYGKGEF